MRRWYPGRAIATDMTGAGIGFDSAKNEPDRAHRFGEGRAHESESERGQAKGANRINDEAVDESGCKRTSIRIAADHVVSLSTFKHCIELTWGAGASIALF